MSNINKVIFDGRISRAPELKYLQTGTAIANFSVAVSGRKNQNGKDEVAFVEVTAWGKTAEYVNSYFNKGSGIVVCGRLNYWRDSIAYCTTADQEVDAPTLFDTIA